MSATVSAWKKQNSNISKSGNDSTANDDNILSYNQHEYSDDIERNFSKRQEFGKKQPLKENIHSRVTSKSNPWNPSGATKSPLKSNNIRKNEHKQAPTSHLPTSPLKRSKYDSDVMDIDSPASNVSMSPSKRQRMQHKPVVSSFKLGLKFDQQEARNTRSNQRSSSLHSAHNEAKKSFASTPKADRKAAHTTRVKELINRSQQAAERSLSNSWADIIDELEEQTKELNDYAEKISDKYKLNKDEVLKKLESDVEVLRKRQKQINYGKVTQEYQNYLLAMHKADRKSSHPRTPNKFRKCSRRQWDGLVKQWRIFLHAWNENPNCENFNAEKSGSTNDFGAMSNISVDEYELVDGADE